MVGQHFVEIGLHQSQNFAVSFRDDRSVAVHVEEDAERAEMIASLHLASHVLAVRRQPLHDQTSPRPRRRSKHFE